MRGFSVPLVLIAVVLVGGLAIYGYSSSLSQNIKGVSTSSHEGLAPGFRVSIISDGASWDLVEYLCVTVEECLTSLTAGKRLSTISGGATELREVAVSYSKTWEKYSYVKVLVRPSWSLGSSAFRVVTPGDIPGTTVEKIPVRDSFQAVLMIPLSEISSVFYTSATFSDR